jgi:hypothetical protein
VTTYISGAAGNEYIHGWAAVCTGELKSLGAPYAASAQSENIVNIVYDSKPD